MATGDFRGTLALGKLSALGIGRNTGSADGWKDEGRGLRDYISTKALAGT